MKIRGNTVGTNMKRPDFNQTDPKKSDYIRNNPIPRVTKEDEGKTVIVKDGRFALGVPTADGSVVVNEDSIIDVISLPTTNINEKAFYRLLTATFMHNRYPVEQLICCCVDELPTVGETATDLSLSTIKAYYNMQDNEVYCYVAEAFVDAIGLPIGWYHLAPLLPELGYTYKGVIYDINDDLNDDTIRLLLHTVIYVYKNKWTPVSGELIKKGNGEDSVVFNHWANTADGDFAASFGVDTAANGKGSFTVGRATEALGEFSVALGNGSIAFGENAVVLGQGNKAIGRCTNAKGYYSIAYQDHASASGHKTLAFDKFARSDGFSSRTMPYDASFNENAILNVWKRDKNFTAAVRQMAKADGSDVMAFGYHSLAMGYKTFAEGEASAAFNTGTHASGMNQTVVGSYNVSNTDAVFIAGNGTGDNDRKNAFVVWKDGRATIGAPPQYEMDVVPKEYVDNRFNGANKAVAYDSYQVMIRSLNELYSWDHFVVGQNIMIRTLNVPDLWVSEVRANTAKVMYKYTTDEDFVAELAANGKVHVGFWVISQLETQKVDLIEIEERLSALGFREGSVALDYTPTSTISNVIKRQGNYVLLDLQIDYGRDTPAVLSRSSSYIRYILGKVPEEFRPKEEVAIPYFYYASTYNNFSSTNDRLNDSRARIYPDGTVALDLSSYAVTVYLDKMRLVGGWEAAPITK